MQVYSESGMEETPLMNLILSLSQDHVLIGIHQNLDAPKHKIQLVVKAIIALQQIQYVCSALEENDNSSFRRMMKHLIEGNTSHMTYMLNYFQQKEAVNNQVYTLIVRNNLRLLLFKAPIE